MEIGVLYLTPLPKGCKYGNIRAASQGYYSSKRPAPFTTEWENANRSGSRRGTLSGSASSRQHENKGLSIKMAQHTHEFVENYDGIGAFGWDRNTDEETIMFYLQKFSDDALLKIVVNRMTDTELEEIYTLINRLLKTHLTETEYHTRFLKDGTHQE